MLALKTGSAVLPLSFVPSRRIVIKRAWDRIQIPMPFCRIDAHFGDALFARPEESTAEFTARIQRALWQLEHDTDPGQAAPEPPASKRPASQQAAA